MGDHTNHDGFETAEVRDVLDAVRRIVRCLRMGSRAAERDVGLSAAQLFVLSKLAAAPALSVNELARRTLTHQSSVSVVVHRLVSRRLVAQSRSKRDGRQVALRLTARGRALLGRAPDLAQVRLIGGLRRMSRSHQQQLASLLSRFVAMAGIDEPAEMFFERSTIRKSSRHARTSS